MLGLLAIVIPLIVHELGHYAVAKICGVRVRAVSIGYGRELVGVCDPSGTRWKFSVLPLGGYVQMAGGTDPKDSSVFDNRSRLAKLAIMSGGIAANLLLSFILLLILFAAVGERVATAEITDVLPDGPAASAGIQPGDVISAIAGQSIAGFEDIADALKGRGGQPTPILLANAWGQRTRIVTPKAIEIRRRIGPPREEVRIGIWHKRHPGTPWDLVVRFLPLAWAEIIPHAARRTGELIAHPFVVIWRALDDIPSDDLLAKAKPPRLIQNDENTLDALRTIAGYDLNDAAYFMAFASIAFGLFNLLPFPPLDGWNIGADMLGPLIVRRLRKAAT